jgi:DNA modification methylase
MEYNKLVNQDCMEYMKNIGAGGVELTLTDIPYGEVNRDSNGLRELDKGAADVMIFNIQDFLDEIYRITRSTIIIFCGKEQLSEIHRYFSDKQKQQKGTVRQLIWRKTNPSPMNGQNIYLSGIENAVWFKKRGGTFNAYCKNTVFDYPCGRSKIHPTEKNHELLKELILDNSNEGDVIFDPCAGSGSHLLVAKENNRQWLGCEINNEWFDVARNRLK